MIRLTIAEMKRFGLKTAFATPPARATAAVRCRAGRMPEEDLWTAVRAQFPHAQREFAGAVPGRRYRIDIALEAEKIAIEIDGWQYHGKFKSAHEADRERQNHLAVSGWLVLRFTAGQIFKDLQGVSATIEKAAQQRRGQGARWPFASAPP